jgi:hypothetical protein
MNTITPATRARKCSQFLDSAMMKSRPVLRLLNSGLNLLGEAGKGRREEEGVDEKDDP